METRARYILVGLFTAAVIGATFVFIYWMENTTTLRDRTVYQIRFEHPVSGLLVGASVAFNGIRVGEITDLRLNPKRPNEFSAIIAVDSTTPVRADTLAEIDYQGVTGVATILLIGGSAMAPMTTASDGQVPQIAAKPMAGRNWSLLASDVLGRVENILAENSKPLNSTLESLSKFTDTLAQNTDRIDSILAGLERMTGGSNADAQRPTYDLVSPQTFPPPATESEWQLVIPEPTLLFALNTDKILLQPNPGETLMLEDARWSDSLPIIFQEKLIQSFENAGYLQSVTRPIDGITSTHKLLIDIRVFALATYAGPIAEIEFVAKILAEDGKVVAARTFSATAEGTGKDAPAAAASLNQAFAKSVTELVLWTVDTI
ncbi:MAG: ABC-type transport auxiliary lipoprotein family protein [Fimbriimonadaceae bacterium]|nr:ABC-type transport auxiliary lipoprotein family protein [Alphaproteobacteria bacterium]